MSSLQEDRHVFVEVRSHGTCEDVPGLMGSGYVGFP